MALIESNLLRLVVLAPPAGEASKGSRTMCEFQYLAYMNMNTNVREGFCESYEGGENPRRGGDLF